MTSNESFCNLTPNTVIFQNFKLTSLLLECFENFGLFNKYYTYDPDILFLLFKDGLVQQFIHYFFSLDDCFSHNVFQTLLRWLKFSHFYISSICTVCLEWRKPDTLHILQISTNVKG